MRTLPVTLVLAVLFVNPALAQDDADDTRRNSIVRAVEKVSPSVVTVNVLDIQYERVVDPFFDNFFRFFDQPRTPTRVRERPVRGIGSGFLFDPRGYIMTNSHVIENADEISITLADGRNIDVTLVGSDTRSDLAVLKADAENLPFIPLGDSEDLLIGEWMIALGNPFGLLVRDPNPTVSVGVLSAAHRRISPTVGQGERLYQDMIQTDAAINPGNSGGPLVNSVGDVVGVNTFIFSQSGGNVGLGFAIPVNRAKRVAGEIIRYGHRRDPWPGFTVVAVDEGAMVSRMLEACPARDAGLKPGDVIVGFNGEPIVRTIDLDFAFWSVFVGDTVTLTVREGKDTREVQFEIAGLRE